MKITNTLLMLAVAGSLTACDKKNSDTANPGEATPEAAPVADPAMDESMDESAAETPAEDPVEDAAAGEEDPAAE